MKVRRGCTRTVLLVGRWAIKVPSIKYRRPIRGWLANRSEWRQRRRPDVFPPVLTICFVVQVYRRASWTARWQPEHCPFEGYSVEESKGESWGLYPGGGWKLIDYDRSWAPNKPRQPANRPAGTAPGGRRQCGI